MTYGDINRRTLGLEAGRQELLSVSRQTLYGTLARSARGVTRPRSFSGRRLVPRSTAPFAVLTTGLRLDGTASLSLEFSDPQHPAPRTERALDEPAGIEVGIEQWPVVRVSERSVTRSKGTALSFPGYRMDKVTLLPSGSLPVQKGFVFRSIRPLRFVDFDIGAGGETRTHTACATAPSRRRVYQFHHVGTDVKFTPNRPTRLDCANEDQRVLPDFAGAWAGAGPRPVPAAGGRRGRAGAFL